ncbi:MAG: Alpha-L-rhamnosidase [Candidatus Gottesmanbacteria bacterium GW2011_GWA2_41_12]|uniref:Alpha-L-rhamnosidase n=1 Tax=Candidatus Gottesmanbacteria bacterium GW2011_GWA2_41_12 TaxID=1618440 RepID=A0A0G0XL51_9BACT|nr:MAG: Alpha-L-rhamnosidase [Candidatus Gottesmanbacteria bacterium GW2011_GWA2_41_12]
MSKVKSKKSKVRITFSVYLVLLTATAFIPSFIIPFLSSQRILGFEKYISFSLLYLTVGIFTFFIDRKRKIFWWYILLSPLVFLEVYIRLINHNLDIMFTPYLNLVIAFVLTRQKSVLKIILKIKKYGNLLFLLFIVYLMFTYFNDFTYLPGKIWKGKWIWSHQDEKDQFLVFEKKLLLPPLIRLKKVPLTITAKSIYRLYINNKFVGIGPGPIDDNNRYFDSYDITKYLHPGINLIKIEAYNYGDDSHFQKKQTGGVLAQIEINSLFFRTIIGTDKTWLVSQDSGWIRTGPKTADGKTYGGEIGTSVLYDEVFDFGVQKRGFNLSDERRAKIEDNLFPRDIPALDYTKTDMKKVDKEGYIDFGEMMVGYPIISAKTDGPAKIIINYREDEKSVGVQKDEFIFPGRGNFVHQNLGRRGFRLVRIVWEKGTGEIELGVETVRFPAEKIGDFKSSDDLLNKIYVLGEKTLKLAMQDQFEDSFIHERSQYLGDSLVDMLYGFYSYSPQILARKALYQFASSQRKDGLIETVYPSSLNQTIISYELMFNTFLKYYYLYTGDLDTVKDLIGNGEKIVKSFDKLKNEQGIIDIGTKNDLEMGEVLTFWIDHISPGDTLPSINLSLNALYYQELDSLSYLYSFIDKKKESVFEEEKKILSQKLQVLVSGLNKSQGKVEGHAAVLLINSGALGTELESEIYNTLFRQMKQLFVTGYFNLFYLLAMEKMGDVDGIKSLVKEHWGGMLDRGADTVWETYDPRVENYLPGSKTHAWSAAPTYFLPAYVGGVRPLSPGWSKILIKPIIIGQSAKTEVKTPCGKIYEKWEIKDGNFDITVNKTCQGEVSLVLPFDIEKGKQITFTENSFHLKIPLSN